MEENPKINAPVRAEITAVDVLAELPPLEGRLGSLSNRLAQPRVEDQELLRPRRHKVEQPRVA